MSIKSGTVKSEQHLKKQISCDMYCCTITFVVKLLLHSLTLEVCKV